jgi:hypothetical protein
MCCQLTSCFLNKKLFISHNYYPNAEKKLSLCLKKPGLNWIKIKK